MGAMVGMVTEVEVRVVVLLRDVVVVVVIVVVPFDRLLFLWFGFCVLKAKNFVQITHQKDKQQ